MTEEIAVSKWIDPNDAQVEYLRRRRLTHDPIAQDSTGVLTVIEVAGPQLTRHTVELDGTALVERVELTDPWIVDGA